MTVSYTHLSDGIPNFREPAQKNAKRVLYLLAGLVFVIFLGISALASLYHIIPNANVTVIAMIAEAVFGNGTLLFYLVQVTTAVILTMAANTAFADLPLLLSILARDGFVPRQFMSRGSRLSCLLYTSSVKRNMQLSCADAIPIPQARQKMRM